jgi:DNA mismatch repair ATPase MutS
VGNDLLSDRANLVLITGANQGGKTTFLRALGQAQLMLQCGLFVPAEVCVGHLCQGLFTHFKREEDASMTRGKFAEELERMSRIVDGLKPDGMILFNESFAATNEREGSEIARQVVSALVAKDIQVAYVTHLYDFAHGVHDDPRLPALFLRAERPVEGRRTFKLEVGEPLPTSFGLDLFRQLLEDPLPSAAGGS